MAEEELEDRPLEMSTNGVDEDGPPEPTFVGALAYLEGPRVEGGQKHVDSRSPVHTVLPDEVCQAEGAGQLELAD